MSKLAELDNEVLNKLKVAANEIETKTGFEVLSMVDKGLIEVALSETGEILFSITPKGLGTAHPYREPSVYNRSIRSLKRV